MLLQAVLLKAPTLNPIDNIENAITRWYNALESLIAMVQVDPTSQGRIGALINNLINNVTVPVGDALVVLCFFIGIFGAGATMAETKRPEAAVRLFVRTAIAGSFVTKGYTLVTKILGIGQSLVGDFAGYSSVNGVLQAGEAPKIPNEIKTAIENLPVIPGLIVMVIGLIGSIAITVCTFVVLLTVYGRWFKIYMYMIVSPIPLATLASKTTQNIAIQFLRNFVAVTLEGIVMVMAVWVYKELSDYIGWAVIPTTLDPSMSASTMVFTYLEFTVFNMLILLTVIKTSSQLAKEMFGV